MRASDFSLSFFLSLGSLGLPRFHGLFAFKPRPSFQSSFLVLSGAEIAQGGVSRLLVLYKPSAYLRIFVLTTWRLGHE